MAAVVLWLFVGFAGGLLAGTPLRIPPENRLPEVGDANLAIAGLGDLPLHKAAGERRVIFLGASLTFGLPYLPEGAAGFPTLLERGLSAVFGEGRLHVRAFAQPAVDASQLAARIEIVLRWQPDLVVLVLGANEFLDRAVAGRALLPDGTWARLRNALGANRDVWERLLAGRGGAVRSSEGGLAGGFRRRLRAAGPGRPGVPGLPVGRRDRAFLVARSRRALARIADACRAHGVRCVVALSIQGFEGCPPWASDFAAGPRDLDAFVSAALAAPRAALLPEAELWLERAPDRADLHFVAALAARRAGAPDRARALWRRALDLDLVPLHRTTALVAGLRAESARLGLPFLELDEALRAPDGLPDPARFLDYAHADLAGQRALARHLAERLQGLAWPKLPAGWRSVFEHAVRRWIEGHVDPESIRLARARLAKNNGRWLMLFGNFRDALPFLRTAAAVLHEDEVTADLAFCRRRLQEAQ